jgi:hypothetical protein
VLALLDRTNLELCPTVAVNLDFGTIFLLKAIVNVNKGGEGGSKPRGCMKNLTIFTKS